MSVYWSTTLEQNLKKRTLPLDCHPRCLAELAVFTKADYKEGFLQVELHNESSHLTAFQAPWGRYRWTRMPFATSPAPKIFQEQLEQNLEGLDGVSTAEGEPRWSQSQPWHKSPRVVKSEESRMILSPAVDWSKPWLSQLHSWRKSPRISQALRRVRNRGWYYRQPRNELQSWRKSPRVSQALWRVRNRGWYHRQPWTGANLD